jgi:hypothetical protein
VKAPKCGHGFFEAQPCPWCFGFDEGNRDVVPVVGHGNGWLLRQGDLACPSCGGPRSAGWGCYVDDKPPDHRDPAQCPPLCYGCRIGENTAEAIAKLTSHESARGVKKQRGAK